MSSEKLYTLAEVAKNNTNKNCWFVIHNNVYDVTPFLNEVSFSILLISFRESICSRTVSLSVGRMIGIYEPLILNNIWFQFCLLDWKCETERAVEMSIIKLELLMTHFKVIAERDKKWQRRTLNSPRIYSVIIHPIQSFSEIN